MGKKKNIENQRFGNMIVLRDSGLRYNAKVIWTCQCDCGEIFNVRSDHIYDGTVKNCQKCSNKKRIKDLTGQRFGKLTVLELDTTKKSNKRTVQWKCQCDCGKQIVVDGAHLRQNQTKSCGCLREYIHQDLIKDITGQTFGMLTVLHRTNRKTSSGVYYWLCQCDCGTIKEIDGESLRTGSTISCGCSKRSNGEYKIYSILKENNIQFEEQKTFETCRFPNTNCLARFDFYLSEYNLLIEYDGEQHFSYKEESTFWNNKENFEKCQKRDDYKNHWAKENNILLKRVPYWDYNKIDLEYLLGD